MSAGRQPRLPGAPGEHAPATDGAWFDRLAPQRARWKARNRYYYQEIERLARAVIPPGASVLELGCGTGDLLAALRPSLGVGVDLSGGMVRQARARYGSPAGQTPGAGSSSCKATPTPCPWAPPSTT